MSVTDPNLSNIGFRRQFEALSLLWPRNIGAGSQPEALSLLQICAIPLVREGKDVVHCSGHAILVLGGRQKLCHFCLTRNPRRQRASVTVSRSRSTIYQG